MSEFEKPVFCNKDYNYITYRETDKELYNLVNKHDYDIKRLKKLFENTETRDNIAHSKIVYILLSIITSVVAYYFLQKN
jgi:hypothetical protein